MKLVGVLRASVLDCCAIHQTLVNTSSARRSPGGGSFFVNQSRLALAGPAARLAWPAWPPVSLSGSIVGSNWYGSSRC